MTYIELLRLLDSVSVRGQLDWAWGWSAVPCGDGWLVSSCFSRPDRDSGLRGLGIGRPLFVGPRDSTRAVIGTAFTAIKLVVEHELFEGFHVGEERVLDPHKSFPGAVP